MRVARLAALALAAGCLQAPPGGEPHTVVIDAAAAPPADAAPCPVADACVISESGHTYAAFADHVGWSDAVALCAGIGFHLASDRGDDESALIEGLLDEPIWIGGTDAAVEKEWRWVSGEPFDFENWHSDEPNGERSANCLLGDWIGGGWNDEDCEAVFAYLCEAGPLDP